ncbi:Structural maintenance of chromosomes protein 4 [Malassezia sp. CBS 17886]|nr:Structural maintenance of chromosomes protein 4 [Malassezia sp. CBS 17886]
MRATVTLPMSMGALLWTQREQKVRSRVSPPSLATHSLHLPSPSRTGMRGATTPAAAPRPQKRLVIHKLVLQDFKSYAGRQEIGPFHKSFSSVVGPNGSGKSNVIDALLFVFGWRANKMRQGRLSELIHNSQGNAAVPQCSVEIWFREIVDVPGSEAYTVVPESELVVARTALRTNTSHYTINRKKSSFTEVTALMRQRGIDLDHKRFLILQGEVESIAQMSPKAKTEHDEGLLEYLEDIIGTNTYKDPIEEHAKAVDDTTNARAEKLQRVKIAQREMENLEPKRREAEQFLRDQNELTRLQSQLWQQRMWASRVTMAQLRAAQESVRAQLADESSKHAAAQTESEAVRAEYDTVAAAYDELVQSALSLTKDLERIEKHTVEYKARSKLLQGKRKKFAAAVAQAKSATSEARATMQDTAVEISTLEKDVSSHEASLEREQSALEAICEMLNGKTQALNDSLQAKQAELAPWHAKINDHTAARGVLREERELLAARGSDAAQRVDDAVCALDGLRAELAAKEEESAALAAEKSTLAEKEDAERDTLAGMEAESEALRRSAAAARRTAAEAQQAAAASRSHGDVLTGLMRQSELGLIQGFHGRLGSLGAIDQRYDVAISTACPGLQNLVVESVETGQQCIEHLRKHNLGRANFILLQSLNVKEQAMAPLRTPENAPRLFDLVTPRECRFAPAFYHQLRDTLVAKDLDQANRIAYGAKRWRVVTEDGQLIDKSGTMSGGGSRAARGGMGSSVYEAVSPEQCARLEKESAAVQQALQSHLHSLQQYTALHEATRARAPQVDRQLAMLAMDLRAGRQRMQETEQLLAELRIAAAPDAADETRIRALDTALAQHDGDIAALHEKTGGVQAAIDGLQEKILEAGGVELRTQQSKVEGIREMLALHNERLNKAEHRRSKAENELGRQEKVLSTSAAQLAALDEEITALEKTQADTLAEADAMRAQVEQAQDAAEDRRDVRDQRKALLDEHAESLRAFRALEVEVKQKLEDHERQVSENDKKLRHWRAQHAKLSLHNVGDSDTPSPELSMDDSAPAPDGDGGPQDDATSDTDAAAPAARNASEDGDTPAPAGDVSRGGAPPHELRAFSDGELESVDADDLEARAADAERRVQAGEVNLDILEAFRHAEEQFFARARDLEATTAARDAAQTRLETLRRERLERFMHGFSQISLKLKEMYQTITLGGNAELELVDSLDPFSEGIIFSVMPPKKSWKNISNLSGGEKTLSSLALVFALHAYKPTPLYVMDEIDAALDFRNVSIIANIIKDRTRGAQFIIISLRNNMFELSSRLVGVYKTANCTKSLAINNTDLHRKPSDPATPRRSPLKMVESPTKRGVAADAPKPLF